MVTDETLTWRCTECGDVFESQQSRHDVEWCDCGESWVDHEKHYVRSTLDTVEPVPEGAESRETAR